MLDFVGFGPHKEEAISLLKKVTSILNDFNINHMLISGTLLGYVRHSDFIPWDDDIDLLADSSIFNKLEAISNKYEEINIFYKKESKYDAIKFCFSNGLEINENEQVKSWKESCITLNNKYCWPFVDIFVYENGPGIHNCTDESKLELLDNTDIKIFNPFSGLCQNSFRLFSESEISFFHNEWDKSQFFPLNSVDFLGVDCFVPRNSDYFLSINYGKNYMVEVKPPDLIHRFEN